ncbi:MAG TPA: carbohydrate ABC transporter permease [Bauldia sp.]|nr:carbohydrate ABC transporter permease [Bauldia sp.]
MTEAAASLDRAALPPLADASRPVRGDPFAALYRLLVLSFVAALVLIPLLATALGGFKSVGELRVNAFGLPQVWVWQNYWDILMPEQLQSAEAWSDVSQWGANLLEIGRHKYWQFLGNSLVIGLLTVFLTLAVAAPAAFAFAHLRFFGERFLFNYLVLGLTFPFATAILPLFIKVRDLGLLDTHWGIVLPQVAFGLAISVLLLRNAFRQLPYELVESALMDGCSYNRIFVSIVLPLSRPILSTVAIISFVTSWNNFLLPLVVLNTTRKYPWPMGLMEYQGEYMTYWQLVLAFITLTILPAIVVFVVAQRHIVAGLTAGAVKG